jgi:site-specific recombinase XerD
VLDEVASRSSSTSRPRSAARYSNRAAAGTAGVLRADSRRVLSRIDGQPVVTEPKTAKSKRFVPISQPAERLLRNVRATQAEERSRAGTAWHETAFVFTTEFGEPCDPRNAFRALKVAAVRAGLPETGLHTLRHSAAGVMLTHGVPLRVVSEILGHLSVAIIGDIYGHVAPDVSRQAVDILGRYG